MIILSCGTIGVGVHLGQQDGSIALARQRLGQDAIIGATCHNSLDFCQTSRHSRRKLFSLWRILSLSTKPLAQAADLQILTQAKQLFSFTCSCYWRHKLGQCSTTD